MRLSRQSVWLFAVFQIPDYFQGQAKSVSFLEAFAPYSSEAEAMTPADDEETKRVASFGEEWTLQVHSVDQTIQ